MAEPDWQRADFEKISGLNVTLKDTNLLRDQHDRFFHHFCTTSYLGLDYHPALLKGAVDALLSTGSLRIPNSKNRCKLDLLDIYEHELSTLFSAHCISTLSCSAASAGILPLLASGGVVMFGSAEHKQKILRFGGPCNWSQSLNSASIGAGRASVALHNTDELLDLQKKLQDNITFFDTLIKTKHQGSFTAIRLIHCGQPEIATRAASHLANNGFFTASVFFPVVPKNQAALRITLRADMPTSLIKTFSDLVQTYWHENNLPRLAPM